MTPEVLELMQERHKVFEWIKVNGTHWDAGGALVDIHYRYHALFRYTSIEPTDENMEALRVQYYKIEQQYEDTYDEYVRSLA